MSTVDRIEVRTLPALIAGQRLDQPTFHERYEAMPPGTWAELVGGVVYMPSPLDLEHARRSPVVTTWLTLYSRVTPGVEVLDNATTILDRKGEVQPDAQLRILPEYGGQTRDVGKYVGGGPELVVEVSFSTKPTDLGPKLLDYERTGVREYVVATAEPDDIYWHARRGGRLVRMSSGDDGTYRSSVFPGLWLNPAALLSRNLNDLIATLDRGLATPEHAAFVARLAEAGRACP